MAWQDRNYSRDRDSSLQGSLSNASVVTWLLLINAAIFVWDSIFYGSLRGDALTIEPLAAFSVEKSIFKFQVWRILTYQFVHGNFLHLMFNMIVLYFFGPTIEQWWGSRRFLAFYLTCGASGAIIAALLGTVPGLILFHQATMLVGASGSIFGILIGCASLFPHRKVRLIFPPIPMTMRTLALVVLTISALSVISGSANAGGEAAHLGGALLGFVLVKNADWLNWADSISPRSTMARLDETRWQRQQKRTRLDRAKVDHILDKVRDQGLQSLTRKEKKLLAKATDQHRRSG